MQIYISNINYNWRLYYMDINFEYYKTFYYVTIYGSISKAANFLHISQPAITKSIQKLEQELDMTLLYRTPKGVCLTENGKIFFEFIKNGVESFMNGEHKLTALNHLETGLLRIGASTTITKYFLLPYIESFHKTYPKIDISITNHLTNTLLSLLKKGSLDFLLVNLPMKSDDSLNVIPCAKLHDCFARKFRI